MPYMKRDILMIENQLPLFLLRTLLCVFAGRHRNTDVDQYINTAVLDFCVCQKGLHVGTPESSALGLHALDLFRRSRLLLCPGRPLPPIPCLPSCRDLLQLRPKRRSIRFLWTHGDESSSVTIRSATRLHECGIRFRRSPSSSFNDIHFEEGSGELFLPHVMVDDATECEFLNMVAFEHLHAGSGNGVSAFVQFMGKIIDVEKDVDVLHRRGVVGNALGGDRNLAELFNNLAKEITIGHDERLREVEARVSRYCQRRRNRWNMHLKQYYFRSPWTVLSIVAAAFAILLSLLQTIYTVWGFYQKK